MNDIKDYFDNLPDSESPLEYDGPDIFRCKGCKIDWLEGKDVTQKTIKIKKIKARKGAKSSPEKALTKCVAADSFFTFFGPPDVPEDPKAEVNDDDRAVFAIDFDVGFAIKEKIIPRAVLYFTGDLFEDDDEFEDCDTEDEEEDEDDEDGEKQKQTYLLNILCNLKYKPFQLKLVLLYDLALMIIKYQYRTTGKRAAFCLL